MATKVAAQQSKSGDINFYNKHPYNEFWIGRDYEHRSEVMAITRLLKNRHFKVALDYGGGYGRLAPVLADYADEIILSDPSSTLLEYAKDHHSLPNLKTILLKKDAVIPVEDSSIDLVIMIRVLHHIINPEDNLKEVYRVLKPKGLAIIEVANNAHAINRLKYLSRFKSVPKSPVPIGLSANGLKETTPFVNHHARTIEKLLKNTGFEVKDILSVSNLRSQYLKKHFSLNGLLAVEGYSQKALAPFLFGPSIFFLVEKK